MNKGLIIRLILIFLGVVIATIYRSPIFMIIIAVTVFIDTSTRDTRAEKKRIKLLIVDCDPEAYLKDIEEEIERVNRWVTKSPETIAILNVRRARAYMNMGEFEKTKAIILSVKRSYLRNTGAYEIMLILCLYQLGEIELAQEVYEKDMIPFVDSNKRMADAIESLEGVRFFYSGRYEESRQIYHKALNLKLNKVNYLTCMYKLAEIDEKLGDLASAKDKYKEIADNGNKLYIAKQAKVRVLDM